MSVTTRSGSTSPMKKAVSSEQISRPSPQQAAPKHFILPKDVSNQARFLLLTHPRDDDTQRFLFCPDKGLYHFTKIGASSVEPRSLLLARPFPQFEDALSEDHGAGDQTDSTPREEGYISKTAELLVATPFDLAFILIPLVMPARATSGKTLFQPIDDILDERIRGDQNIKYLVEHGRPMVEEAMSRFCDTINTGDEQMFRPSEEKILDMILQKVHTAIQKTLPSTLEERFVTRALEAPILSVRREETAILATKVKTKSLAPDEGDDDEFDALDSQSSTASAAPSAVFSKISTTSSTSTVIPEPASLELLQLQQERIVLNFILTSYVPDGLAERLETRLTDKDSPVNFGPLEEHLTSLAALRAEALSSRSITDFSRKRGLEDDETAELRAEKKKRQDEDEKKKRLGQSNGVRALKKVNVAGMKKMSDFFSKKPAAKIG